MLSSILESIIAFVTNLTGGDTVLTATIMGAVTVSLSGAVGFVLWKAPKIIFYKLLSFSKTSFSINTSQWDNLRAYEKLDQLAYNHAISFFSRQLSLGVLLDRTEKTEYGHNKSIFLRVNTLGLGDHLMYWEGSLFGVTKKRLDSHGDSIHEEITISSFGVTQTKLKSLIVEVSPKSDDEPRFYTTHEGNWIGGAILPSGGLDSLALSDETKRRFRDNIEFYLNSESEYRRLGLAWKITWMLHGLPGSGKTAVIRAIAVEYKLNVCILDLISLSNKALTKLIGSVPKGSLLLIEDCDGIAATANREDTQTTHIDDGAVSLSGLLNTLDGISPLDGVMVFMTTNYIDKIDGAILRDARTDHVIELPLIMPDDANEYFNKAYDTTGFDIKEPILAATIAKIKIDAKINVTLAKELASNAKFTLLEK